MVQNNSRSKAPFCHLPSSIFLSNGSCHALEEHDGKVSIGGRNITNLRLVDDIDTLAVEEQEREALV